jgi:ABC-type transporter Mla subunit MlaD
MSKALSIAAALAALAVAAVLLGAGGDSAEGKRYDVVFDNAFGLVEGGDVKIGGVHAGRTVGFHLTDDQPVKVAAEIELTEPGFDELHRDAHCDVRQQSLIGEYFIDCQPGRGAPLADGGTVPVSQTASTIPPDLINNVMRRPYRERFRLILSELGVGLTGRPDELNEVIRRAHPALRETTQTLKILADQNKVISDFIHDADRVSAAVEPKKFDVSRWAQEASETADVQASRADQIGEQWRKLPRFLAELEPTAAQLEATASKQIPLLRRLQTAAPDLERFLAELGPFSEESRGQFRALARSARTGRQAIGVSREEVDELRKLSYDAPRLGRPLRQFLQTIDDRGRSIENDPSAGVRAPAAPDKTAYKKGQGYTGMEALLNYVYWQTMGINAFDQVGHVLRIALLAGGKCAPYSSKPSKEVQKQCNSWLGPNQPGVTTPDPTGETPEETAKKEAAARERDRRGEPRRAGDPEAKPEPGKPDLSKPQIVLPPEIQDLLDKLPGVPEGTLPDASEVDSLGLDGASSEQLLDYLLAP